MSAVAPNGDQIAVKLDWPQQFSESELLERHEEMPSAASASHPAMRSCRDCSAVGAEGWK